MQSFTSHSWLAFEVKWAHVTLHSWEEEGFLAQWWSCTVGWLASFEVRWVHSLPWVCLLHIIDCSAHKQVIYSQFSQAFPLLMMLLQPHNSPDTANLGCGHLVQVSSPVPKSTEQRLFCPGCVYPFNGLPFISSDESIPDRPHLLPCFPIKPASSKGKKK